MSTTKMMALTLALVLVSPYGALAAPNDGDVPDSNGGGFYDDGDFHVDVRSRFLVVNGEDANGDRQTKGSLNGFDLLFTQRLMEHLWAFVQMRLDSLEDNEFEFEKEESVFRSWGLQLDKTFDSKGQHSYRLTATAGKHQARFGDPGVEQYILGVENPVYAYLNERTSEVIGFSLGLSVEDLNDILKRVAVDVSLFDSNRNDFDDINSESVKLSVDVGNVALTGSYADLEDQGKYVAFTAETRFEGAWNGYVSYVDETEARDGTEEESVASIGVTYDRQEAETLPGQVVIQASAIEDIRNIYGVAYKFKTKNAGIPALGVQRVDEEDGDDQTQLVFSWEIDWSNTSRERPEGVVDFINAG